MKRIILILLVVLALAGIAASLWGNRFVATTLDARLPPLLTHQLGLPVTLAPIEAHSLQLRASSAKLVMGDPADPAVVATDVEVRLSWPELLTGTIRLVYAGADDLMVKTSRWPRSGKPAPDNYRFLDPWLPHQLEFETGRYVTEDGGSYPVQAASWARRPAGGMKLSWSEQRKGGLASLEADLASLMDLLDLTDFQLSLQGAIDGVPASDFSLSTQIQPGDDSAYELDATLEAIDTQVSTKASGRARWAWPDTSRSHYQHLEPVALGKFLDLYDDPGKEDTAETFLATALPALDLIAHKGHLIIDEFKVAGDIIRNTRLDFVADNTGLRIDPLRMEGLKANLQGSVIITSATEGWDFSLETALQAKAGGSIGPAIVETEWIWKEGNAQLQGSGKTWGGLLYSLEGQIAATGHHHAKVDTPVKIDAMLDSHPGKLAFDHLEIALGEGHFHGSAELSGTEQRKLTLDLTGEKLNVDFLFDTDTDVGGTGVAVPKYLNILPSLDLDWTLNVSNLHAPGLSLASAHARLERNDAWGKLVARATGLTGGTLDLSFEADYPGEDAGHYEMRTKFHQLDLPGMFQQPNALLSRNSGTLNFDGSGMEMLDIFKDLRGTASFLVEVRPDNNWQRPARDNEQLKLDGTGSFVIEGTDIMGISIENLDIESSEQDLTGSLSMVAGGSPWLIADLESEKLDINGLLELLPESSEEADRADLLQSARDLGAGKISLKVDSLTVGDAPVSQLDLTLVSDQDLFKIDEIIMLAHGSRLDGTGEITWQGKQAKIELATRLTDVDLDQFLIRDPTLEHVRVNGTAQLSSEGETVAELLGNFTGHIDLKSKEINKSTGEPRRQLLMKARRLPNGVQADVEKLRLSQNFLIGSLRYTRSTPPQVEIDIHDGTFSLLPWESEHVETDKPDSKKKKEEKQGSGIRRAASASAGAVGRVLTAPLRMFEASEDRSKARMFSDDPLPLDTLHKANVTLKGKLDTLESSVATLHELSFEGTLKDGALDLSAHAGELNEGQAKLDLKLDANAQPPSLAVDADFNEVRGLTSENTYTRSGFASVEARGQSTAALAASLNGMLYLELGPGPFDYRNATLLSSSIASQVFGTLIPGAEREQPQLECGITVAEFNNGKGVTPYGFAVRTNQANLLGHLKVDLARENMQLNFESRSRRGVGLSVGNVVSNSVQVRGSLTDPHIVPRATSLAWRGWAAFMTVGLSVVAESVLKRAMASENPCPPIKKLISTELCPKSEIARSSERMCPQGQPQG